MEAFGSGGIVLLVVAVLWLLFMTPTGQKRERKVKTKSIQLPTIKKTNDIPAKSVAVAETPINKGLQPTLEVASVPEKVVISPLPDPLSARIGTIENIPWAEVKDLEKVREEKAKISSENLDEILQRRRANG